VESVPSGDSEDDHGCRPRRTPGRPRTGPLEHQAVETRARTCALDSRRAGHVARGLSIFLDARARRLRNEMVANFGRGGAYGVIGSLEDRLLSARGSANRRRFGEKMEV
jgi:hypothetical protein